MAKNLKSKNFITQRFSRDDSLLICCSVAGIIRIWNSRTFRVVSELITRGTSYTGMTLHPQQDWLFLISTEKSIIQYEMSTARTESIESARLKLIGKLETYADENATCIEIDKSGDLICIGTNKGTCLIKLFFISNMFEFLNENYIFEGSIRLYFLPDGSFREFRCHFTHITRLCFTSLSEYLLVSCEDGSVFVYSLNFVANLSQLDENLKMSEELFLINATDRTKRVWLVEEWKAKLEETRHIKELDLRKQKLKFKMSQRAILLRSQRQMTNLMQSIHELTSQANENENYFNEK